MIRAMLVACVVIVAVLCTPAMLAPGINSADLIIIAAPFAVVAIVAWRPERRVNATKPRPVSTHFDTRTDTK